MSNLRFIGASKELSSIGGRLSIRAASILAGGAIAAELVRPGSCCLAVSTTAEFRLLAEAALHAGAFGNPDAVVAATELVGVAVTALVFGAGGWCVPE